MDDSIYQYGADQLCCYTVPQICGFVFAYPEIFSHDAAHIKRGFEKRGIKSYSIN